MPSQYGDLSIFNARGGDPVEEREAARAEGSKRAAYLSSMDQFYAQLDFLKEVEAGKREMFEEELTFKGKELTAQEKHWSEQISLGREQIGAEEKRWQTELEELRRWHDTTAGLERDKLSEQKSEFGKTYGLEANKFKLFADLNAPVKYQADVFRDRPGTYYRDASAYGGSKYVPITGGGIGAGTQARWAQESAQEHEKSIFDAYFEKAGSLLPSVGLPANAK